jgi:hypothetical protein
MVPEASVIFKQLTWLIVREILATLVAMKTSDLNHGLVKCVPMFIPSLKKLIKYLTKILVRHSHTQT